MFQLNILLITKDFQNIKPKLIHTNCEKHISLLFLKYVIRCNFKKLSVLTGSDRKVWIFWILWNGNWKKKGKFAVEFCKNLINEKKCPYW